MGWAGGSDSEIDVEMTGLKLWVGVEVEYMQENSARLATTTTDEDETADPLRLLHQAFELARQIRRFDEKVD